MTRDGYTILTAHCPTCARPALHIQLANGTFVCKTCLAKGGVR